MAWVGELRLCSHSLVTAQGSQGPQHIAFCLPNKGNLETAQRRDHLRGLAGASVLLGRAGKPQHLYF